MEKYDTVDEYISSLPENVKPLVQKLRSDLGNLVPDAKEKMSYGIPTLTLNGNLIHFAGYQNHIGLYPGAKAVEVFAEELKNFKTSKGTIQFPFEAVIPMDLIAKIVEFCVKENLAKRKR